MPINLIKPNIGSIDWGESANENWQGLMDYINGVSRRNVIINGNMRINQRNPGASNAATTDQGYVVDRFYTEKNYDGTLTWSHSTDVPSASDFENSNIPFQNFGRSLQVSSTQSSAPGIGTYLCLSQKIEGYNIQDILGDGYNSAFTLSFWVKSSTTGTYCVGFRSSGADRSYIATYAVDEVNTWEYKSIAVLSAPSGGTWNQANGIGLYVSWTLLVGTTYGSGTNDTWTSSNSIASSSQDPWCTGTGPHNFWLTGVQLEPGSYSTPYRFLCFQQELDACQRYFQRVSYNSTLCAAVMHTANYVIGPMLPFSVKRATPTFNASTGFSFVNSISTTTVGVSSFAGKIQENGYSVECALASNNGSAGDTGYLTCSNSYFDLNAEL
jgi:hypothetical protein